MNEQELKSSHLFQFFIYFCPDFDQTAFLNEIFRFRVRHVETRFFSGFVDWIDPADVRFYYHSLGI